MNDYEDLMELTDKELWDQLPKVEGASIFGDTRRYGRRCYD